MLDIAFAIIMETIFGACWWLSLRNIMDAEERGSILFNLACFVLAFLYWRWLIVNV